MLLLPMFRNTSSRAKDFLLFTTRKRIMTTSDRSGPANVKKEFEEKYFECAANGDVEELKFLTKGENFVATVDINLRNPKGWTALMLAARHGRANVVKTLLERGCDVNMVNSLGHSAVDIATFWDQKEVADILTKHSEKQNPDRQLRNFFSLNTIDRCAALRKNAPKLEALKSSEDTRFLLFQNLKAFVLPSSSESSSKRSFALARFDKRNIETVLNTNPMSVFLGIDKEPLYSKGNGSEQPLFALDVTGKEEKPFKELYSQGFFMEPFPGSLAFEPKEAGIFAEARTLLDWLDRYKFCATCGSATTVVEGGYKRVCNNSECISNKGIHNTCYPRCDPSVIMLVVSPDDRKCLLGRAKRFPPKMWSCLSGFMEPGESLEDTCRREVMEESGVHVSKVDYHSSQPWPFPCSLMLGCIAKATTTDIKVDEEEMEEVRWFDRPEVVQMLIRQHPDGFFVPPEQAIAHQVIKSWVRMSANL